MKKVFLYVFAAAYLIACNNDKDLLTVHGTVKNIPDQEVYLVRQFFTDRQAEVQDTAILVNGKFSLQTKATEEGLYQIRFQNTPLSFLLINDESNISIDADASNVVNAGPTISSRASKQLNDFIHRIDEAGRDMQKTVSLIDSFKNAGNDSLLKAGFQQAADKQTAFTNFILKYSDTVSNPILAMFSLGYSQGAKPADLKMATQSLAKRFDKNQGVVSFVNYVNGLLNAPPPKPAQNAIAGKDAPDFTMNDPKGKPISLHSFRGKYVLVDFWASWCGPCRAENPNVVAAYNKFKDKNFTILGVSLDDEKEKWLAAIEKDKLTWQHVSDLNGWGNATVALYKYEGIPYNVLVNPEGKIIASELRGRDLEKKLEEVLK